MALVTVVIADEDEQRGAWKDGDIVLHDELKCGNLTQFDRIKGIKPVCTINKGRIKKKWRCNLKCENGSKDIWSIRLGFLLTNKSELKLR